MQVLLSFLLLTVFPVVILSGKTNLAWETCAERSLAHTPDTQAVITGLFDIRRKSGIEDPKLICGPISEEGVTTLEAVRWALGRLNQDYGEVFGQKVSGSFVPGIRIGIDIFDTCGNINLAVRQILGSFSDLHSPSGHCIFNQTQINLGILGPRSSTPAVEISKLLKQYQLPVVSHGATLVKSAGFENFFRTVPSVSVLSEAMISAASHLSWKRLAIVYSNCSYGSEGKEYLLKWASKYGICISNVEEIPSHFEPSSEEKFSSVVNRLRQNLPAAPAVLVFASKEASMKLIQNYAGSQPQASVTTEQNQLNWIFSDSVTSNIQEVAQFPIPIIRGLFSVGSSAPSRDKIIKCVINNMNIIYCKSLQ